jgi:hypothetical protein
MNGDPMRLAPVPEVNLPAIGWKCLSYGSSNWIGTEIWMSAVASPMTVSLQRVGSAMGAETRCGNGEVTVDNR